MSGKQITELETASSLEDGDLMLVRKTANNVDRSISKANLIESIGNAAVSGFIASSSAKDKITLAPSNAALVPKYANGMKIGFISPITTSDIVKVKIGTLPYINLQKYSLDETVLLTKGEYVEAIYTNGIFKQTNNLNTHLVWSNEYIAEAEIAPDKSTTVYKLTSAVGVKKPHYYQGMSLVFTVPENSKGVVFVNVDGLGNKRLGESGGSQIAKDVHAERGIMAIYNGAEFIKQKFSTIHVEPVVVEEKPEILEEHIPPVSEALNPEAFPAKPVDIWAEDYPGDPDDPANTSTPNALDSRGRPIFAKTITVGNSAMYKTLPEAIAALINDYGNNGGGQRFAIEIDSSYAPVGYVSVIGHKPSLDLRWITIFGKNNTILNFNSVHFNVTCKYSPIFNCKMSFDRSQKIPVRQGSLFYENGLTTSSDSMTFIFGKNTNIIYKPVSHPTQTFCYSNQNIFMEAKYGLRFDSTAPFFGGIKIDLLINKGVFTFTFDNISVPLFYFQTSNAKIYNTVFNIKGLVANRGVLCFNHSEAYLRNVKSTDRTGEISAVRIEGESNITLENCNFLSKTNGEQGSGFDIFMAYRPKKLHLKNTTGNLNYPEESYETYNIIRE